jgi:hypothetical protein
LTFEGLKARATANTASSPLLSRQTIEHSPLSLFAALRRKRCQYNGRAEKDSAYVEEFFVSRASAVERIVLARRALMKEIEGTSAGAFALSQGPSLLDRLEQLMFDVRAGRISDFVMPSLTSKVRILVMAD